MEVIVGDVNRFLRGWAAYFQYGNSADRFDKIRDYAMGRLAGFIAKKHWRTRRLVSDGMRLVYDPRGILAAVQVVRIGR